MLRGAEKRHRVVHRGPVSGTGKVLEDEEALKILDERVEPAEREVPDIGVVIERPGAETDPADGQQRLGLWEDFENRGEPFYLIDKPRQHGATPFALTWEPWTEGCMICEQSALHPIFKAGLGTKLPLLIDASRRKQETREFSPSSHRFPLRMRLVFGDSVVDVPVEPKDLDQPDLTLRDLLVRATVGLKGE